MVGTISQLSNLVLVVLSLSTLASAEKLGGWLIGKYYDAPASAQPAGDLMVKVASALGEDQVPGYERALEVLDSFETLPSCSRQAWSRLIISCSHLETLRTMKDDSPSPELALEDVRSAFATRLAVCELSVVSTEVLPRSCASLLTSDKGKFTGDNRRQNHKSFTSGPASHTQHRACLSDIFQDTRFWTSYSNSLQNARAICEVSKKHVEKDEALHFYRSMLEVAKKSGTLHSETLERMRGLQSEMLDFITMLKTANRAHAAQASQTASQVQDAFAPILTQIQSAGININSLLEVTRSVANQAAKNAQQQGLAHSDAMRDHQNHAEAVRIYLIAIDKFLTQIEHKTGGLSRDMTVVQSTLQKLLPQFTEGLAKWDLTNNAMDMTYEKSLALKKLAVETGEHFKNLALQQEEAHNTTMSLFATFQAQFQSGIFSLGSASWVLRSLCTWFHQMPTFAIALGYFLIGMSVAMLFTIAGRKFATLPLRMAFTPIHALAAFVITAPWPMPVVTLIMSIYFGFIEQPSDCIDRWSKLAIMRSDLTLIAIVALPITLWTFLRFGEAVKAAAQGLPTEEKAHCVDSD